MFASTVLAELWRKTLRLRQSSRFESFGGRTPWIVWGARGHVPWQAIHQELVWKETAPGLVANVRLLRQPARVLDLGQIQWGFLVESEQGSVHQREISYLWSKPVGIACMILEILTLIVLRKVILRGESSEIPELERRKLSFFSIHCHQSTPERNQEYKKCSQTSKRENHKTSYVIERVLGKE